jgi:hypothetical protein
MEKAQEILFHIDELYTENPSEDKIRQMAENNPTRYQAWVDAFKDYDLPDVLTAIDNFWEFKSSKTKPNVAQIKAILTSHKAEKLRQAAASAPKKELPTPENLMAQDVAVGCCRNNLYVYREAFDICLNQFLPEVIPADVAEHAFYPRNVQLAVENGVFGRFDEAMLMAAQRRFRRDYEFPSANDLEAMKKAGVKPDSSHSLRMTEKGDDAVKTLSAYWRAA